MKILNLGKFSNSQDVLVKNMLVFQRRFNLICATLIISGGTSSEFIPFITLEGSAYLSEIPYLGKRVYGKINIFLTVNLWKFIYFDERRKTAQQYPLSCAPN